MELSATLNSQEQSMVRMQVDSFNKVIEQGKKTSQNLGKDDFIKILITQLSHQDPTAPMEDKEFIAQMAQFSSLEQLTNLNAGLESMTNFAMTNAVNYIGRTVTFYNSDGEELSYKVTSVTFNQGEVTLHYDGGSVPLENVIGVA